ncbi:MAG: acetylglutamate kinase [Candidatus Omnitrophica bacterium 4484_49]|nr:MAG: acetylglutamate kinase [Candidatus Omnitrophica bacterium 4484_49]
MEEYIKKAGILVEAFPYIKQFKGKVVVIKYGGRALLSEQAKKNILQDIAFLSIVGIKPVIVHGGGYKITERVTRQGGKIEFVEGKRVTDKKTLRIVYDVLMEVNQDLVAELVKLDASAVSINPGERDVIRVEPESRKLGYVGKVREIKKQVFLNYLRKSRIPVVMPVGKDERGKLYNINADDMASSLAVAFKAEKLVLLTDVKGILREKGNEESLISTLHAKDVNQLIKIGAISGGMIPKVQACLKALENGVKKTHILDGRIPHVILLEVFTTEGVGTEIVR